MKRSCERFIETEHSIRVYMNYSYMNYIKNLPFFKKIHTGLRSVSILPNILSEIDKISKYIII